jgi:proton-coupled amino acid transporter
VGSLTCTPIAFILPALFHYKTLAETKAQKIIDLSIVVLGTIIMVFCTAFTIVTW